MKIGFVWHNDYPWDVRLEKITKVCLQNGHQVSLLCRGRDSLLRSETLNGIKIHRVYPPRIFRAKWAAKAAGFPFFFNPLWIVGLVGFVRRENFDLLVVRDLPLAFLVGAIGKMFRTPVILDMAENYPAALMAYQNSLYKPFLFSNAWLPKQYEKLSMRLLDHTLVVTDEQARRLEALGVEASKITVVSNTPEMRALPPITNESAISRVPDDERTANLLFVGKLDPHRGVHLVIQALPDLLREFPQLTLTLVGVGTERARLEQMAESLGMGSSVQMQGWVEFRNIWGYIGQSTVCLIPHLRSEHTDTTLPNKLFDYMALGKPVVASNCAPMERIIRETDCGLTFVSGDVVALQAALRKLLSNPEARVRMGRNGMKAVREKYNWGIDEKSLLNVLDGIAPDSITSRANLHKDETQIRCHG